MSDLATSDHWPFKNVSKYVWSCHFWSLTIKKNLISDKMDCLAGQTLMKADGSAPKAEAVIADKVEEYVDR